MTDIYTVIFTGEYNGAAESIPWLLSFSDLELAKNHVREEASKRRSDEEGEPKSEWIDEEEHSTYMQEYDPMSRDTWTIVRTELVETDPPNEVNTL